MKQKLLYLVMFAAGATIGSAVSWQLAKNKYKQIADEEIQSVKDAFSKKENDINTKLSTANAMLKKNMINNDLNSTYKDAYKDILTTNKYLYSENTNAKKEVPETGPYVISPDEFGELDDYETISLTYYSDKVLADDMDQVIDDYKVCVGNDFMNHFGEYEDDSVFIRNDARKCDYEILYDLRPYSELGNCCPEDE